MPPAPVCWHTSMRVANATATWSPAGRVGPCGFRRSLTRVEVWRGDPVFWPQRRSLKTSRAEPQVRSEVEGYEVTVGVAWLWCIAGGLTWWSLVAWAVQRVV